MGVRDRQEEGSDQGEDPGAGLEATHDQGAVEGFDERRAKMERLRAAGIDPYPPVSLWGKRARIADVLAAHDPTALGHGEHQGGVGGDLDRDRFHALSVRKPNLDFHLAGRNTLFERCGHTDLMLGLHARLVKDHASIHPDLHRVAFEAVLERYL